MTKMQEDFDYLFAAVIADTDALEDAKMTLEVIRKSEPGMYDEMIDESLALIDKALSRSIFGVIERITGDVNWFMAKEK